MTSEESSIHHTFARANAFDREVGGLPVTALLRTTLATLTLFATPLLAAGSTNAALPPGLPLYDPTGINLYIGQEGVMVAAENWACGDAETLVISGVVGITPGPLTSHTVWCTPSSGLLASPYAVASRSCGILTVSVESTGEGKVTGTAECDEDWWPNDEVSCTAFPPTQPTCRNSINGDAYDRIRCSVTVEGAAQGHATCTVS